MESYARLRLPLQNNTFYNICQSQKQYGKQGIGNASKLSWDVTYINTFKVTNLITVSAGYRSFRYKRMDGEGDRKLETNVNASGPMLGVIFRF